MPTHAGELAPLDAELLRRIVARIDALMVRFEDVTPGPAPGSSLAADDRAASPYQVSHAVEFALSVATDNLGGFRSLAMPSEGERPSLTTRPYALFPLLRSALEGAALGLWLLDPPRRNDRVIRRLRLLLDDARQDDKAAAMLANGGRSLPRRLPNSPREKGRREQRADVHIERIAARRDFNPDDVSGAVQVSDLLDQIAPALEALEDRETEGGPHLSYLLVWKLLSGISHGDWWASLSILQRETVAEREHDVQVVRLSTSATTVLWLGHYVTQLLEHAYVVFDKRASNHVDALWAGR